MKILIYTLMVLLLETSRTSDANQHNILFNYQSFEDGSNLNQRIRREAGRGSESEVHHEGSDGHLPHPKREIDLPPGYSTFEVPKPSDGSPVTIFLHLNISQILDFDEFNEEIEVDMDFKVMWTDFQILQYHNNTHPGNGIAQIDALTKEEIRLKRKTDNNPAVLLSIWKPNLFMEGLSKVSQPILMAKPLKVRFINELGWFEYITRLQVQFECSMDFHYYPADTQRCSVSIRGFSYPRNDCNMSWYKNGVHLNDVNLQNFEVRIDEVTHYELVKSDDPDDVFDVLGFQIITRRKLSYHLIQTYLSSSFYIVITTLCFLLPSTMIEARIGMSMTTLLTLTAMFGAVRESTPTVSYTKAIDIWMVGCIFFVFLTLLQFTFNTWVRHVEKVAPTSDEISKEIPKVKKQNPNSYTLKKEDPYEMDDPASNKGSKSSDLNAAAAASRTIKICQRISQFLESYSFPLFLMIFFVYSAVYWVWLLNASAYFDWEVDSPWNIIE